MTSHLRPDEVSDQPWPVAVGRGALASSGQQHLNLFTSSGLFRYNGHGTLCGTLPWLPASSRAVPGGYVSAATRTLTWWTKEGVVRGARQLDGPLLEAVASLRCWQQQLVVKGTTSEVTVWASCESSTSLRFLRRFWVKMHLSEVADEGIYFTKTVLAPFDPVWLLCSWQGIQLRHFRQGVTDFFLGCELLVVPHFVLFVGNGKWWVFCRPRSTAPTHPPDASTTPTQPVAVVDLPRIGTTSMLQSACFHNDRVFVLNSSRMVQPIRIAL